MKLDTLLALQEEDGNLRNLQRELLTVLPTRRKAAKDRLQIAQRAVEAATQANLAAQREYERFQHDYTRQHDHMNRVERNAAHLTHARGLDAASAEYASAERAAMEAQAAAERANENRTPTERRLDEARQFEEEESAIVQAQLEQLDARKVQVEAEITNLQAHRDALAAAVDPMQLHYYNRVRKTCWPAVVTFNRHDSVCTGCNLVQPASVKQAVLAAEKSDNMPLVHCPSCGRILL